LANERQDDASTVRKLVQGARVVSTSDLADRREVLRSLKRGRAGIAVEYVPPCPERYRGDDANRSRMHPDPVVCICVQCARSSLLLLGGSNCRLLRQCTTPITGGVTVHEPVNLKESAERGRRCGRAWTWRRLVASVRSTRSPSGCSGAGRRPLLRMEHARGAQVHGSPAARFVVLFESAPGPFHDRSEPVLWDTRRDRPVDPCQGRQLHVIEPAPGTRLRSNSVLDGPNSKPAAALGGLLARADGGDRPDLGQPFSAATCEVLAEFSWSAQHRSLHRRVGARRRLRRVLSIRGLSGAVVEGRAAPFRRSVSRRAPWGDEGGCRPLGAGPANRTEGAEHRSTGWQRWKLCGSRPSPLQSASATGHHQRVCGIRHQVQHHPADSVRRRRAVSAADSSSHGEQTTARVSTTSTRARPRRCGRRAC
jgi:hypothetical protein